MACCSFSSSCLDEDTLRIHFDPDARLEPGQVVTGTVTFSQRARETFYGFHVTALGFSRVQWTDEYPDTFSLPSNFLPNSFRRTISYGVDNGTISTMHLELCTGMNHEWNYELNHRRNRRRRVHVSDHETYFNFSIPFGPELVNGQVLLDPGFHSFPFSFTLPQNIPSSCELLMGYVRYSAKITIQRSIFKSNYVTEEAFTVNDGPVDLNQIEAAMLSPCKYVTRPGSPSGSIGVKAWCDKAGFVPGEILNFQGRIECIGTRAPRKCQIRLLQCTTYTATRGRYRTLEVLQVYEENFNRFENVHDINIPIDIPKNIPLSGKPFCSLVDVSYTVELVVNEFDFFGLNGGLLASLDIFIGNIPLQNIPRPSQPSQESNPANVSDQPSQISKDINASNQPSKELNPTNSSDQLSEELNLLNVSDQPSQVLTSSNASDKPSQLSNPTNAPDQPSQVPSNTSDQPIQVSNSTNAQDQPSLAPSNASNPPSQVLNPTNTPDKPSQVTSNESNPPSQVSNPANNVSNRPSQV